MNKKLKEFWITKQGWVLNKSKKESKSSYKQHIKCGHIHVREINED